MSVEEQLVQALGQQVEAAETALNEIASMIINSARDFEMRAIARNYFAQSQKRLDEIRSLKERLKAPQKVKPSKHRCDGDHWPLDYWHCSKAQIHE